MRTARRRRTGAAAALVSAALLLTAACGGSDSDGGGTSATASSCKPAGKKVTLTFTSWVPGMQETVDLWNKNNPDIQVDYKEVVGGNQGTYQAYSNQIKAGKTPDIGMIEFDNLPSFRLQDGLQNVGGCDPVKEAEGKYVDWAISQVGFGEKGAVYGIPMDIGPMALYYRKDLFDQAGIPVPTTWDEYYDAAQEDQGRGRHDRRLPDRPAGVVHLARLAERREVVRRRRRHLDRQPRRRPDQAGRRLLAEADRREARRHHPRPRRPAVEGARLRQGVVDHRCRLDHQAPRELGAQDGRQVGRGPDAAVDRR